VTPPPAGFWRRAGAAVLDRLVGALVAAIGVMWLVLGLWTLRRLPADPDGLLALAVSAAGLLLALHVAYQVVLVGGCGQTLGAMVAGIAVLGPDGRPPGYGRAALRCAGGILSAMLLGLPSVPFLFARPPRGFGDWLGGTRVVRLPA
jgi:uncharacterized RDD family membrane protein YckC